MARTLEFATYPKVSKQEEGPINVLLSCAGRHVELVRMFQDALAGRGQVVALDQDKHALALAVADRPVVSPAIDSSEYPRWMIHTCAENNIRLALSLVEADTQKLESVRADLLAIGCRLIGTPPATLHLMNDKLEVQGFLDRLGISYPNTTTLRSIANGAAVVGSSFVVKQRRGRGSQGMLNFSTMKDVRRFARTVPNQDAWIVQERLLGQEFGVDVINDLDGCYAGSFQRRKIRMHAGETQVATTSQETVLSELAVVLAGATGHQGCLDVDVILVEGKPFVIDLNPRFGGGYPFSHAAGANLPALLVAWSSGEPIEDAWLQCKPGITSVRTSVVQTLGPM